MNLPAQLRQVALVTCLVVFFGHNVFSQVLLQEQRTDIPALIRVTPRGLPVGRTTTLTIDGLRLDTITQIVSQAGIRLVKVEKLEATKAVFQVEVSAETVPGCYPVHLLCKSGLSNPKLLRIDNIDQVIEPEKKANAAVEIKVPSGITGKLAPAELDEYTFEVATGSDLVFDLLSHRLGSTVNGELTLFNDSGRQLARVYLASPDISPDVRLNYHFEQSGKYTIRVSDRAYLGDANSQYYLRISPHTFATSIFPAGGQAGQATEFTLSGGSLKEPITRTIKFAADEPSRRFRPRFETATGSVLSPIAIAVGRYPEVAEAGDNDSLKTAQSLALPTTVNGRFETANDRDFFKFPAKKGQNFTIRVTASELGSPVDAVFHFYSPDGKRQATVDDVDAQTRIAPVVRPSTIAPLADDPFVTHTPTADGDYTVCIQNRFRHGGAEMVYRLEVAEKSEDFELIVQPGRVVAAQGQKKKGQAQGARVLPTFAGEGTGALSIDRGGRGSLVVKALRYGYDGPINLAVEGLPSGLVADNAVIENGQTETTLSLNADFDASTTAGFVRIIGTSTNVQPAIKRQAVHAVVLAAIPQSVVTEHEFETIAVAISDRGAELAIRVDAQLKIAPGTKAIIPITIRRREGFVGAVEVKPLRVHEGFTITPITIAADKSAGQLELIVAGDAADGLKVIPLQASMSRPKPKPDPKKKPNKKTAEPPEPLIAIAYAKINVVPLVVAELSSQQLDLKRGTTESLQLSVRRNAANPESFRLKLSRLPRGVTITPTTLPVDADTIELKVVAADDAAASPIRRIIQLTPIVVVNGQTVELPKLRLALKVR
ncbi:MAG: PPC domain-containing protein [Planctomycetota bacterium]|nr:PPC domain-containing protein [Planctomycetota bacterium]